MSTPTQRKLDPAPMPLDTVDPVAAQATEIIGGPLGRFAALGRRGWAAVGSALVALSGVMVALGVVQKSHCLLHGWTDPAMYWRACYSDLPITTVGPALSGGVPYLDRKLPVEEPTLNGVYLWGIGRLAPQGSTFSQHQAWIFGLGALFGMVLLAIAVAAIAWGRPRDAWRASHLALSPVLVTAALLSPDLLGVCAVALACAAWYRGRSKLAGVMAGIALLTGSYAVLVLIGMILVGVRDKRIPQTVETASLAVLTALVLAAPFMLLGPGGFDVMKPFSAYTIWSEQNAGYGSIWKVLELFMDPIAVNHLNLIGWLGFVWAALVGAIVAYGPQRRVGLAPVVIAMTATLMLTGKALPLQQALWLLPLIALSAIPWRDHLIWAGTEIVYFVAVWMHLPSAREPGKALDAEWYAIFTVLRFAGILYLTWRAIRTGLDEALVAEEDVEEELRERDRESALLDTAPRTFGA